MEEISTNYNNSQKISFDNFDITRKNIRISSPTSLLACKFMGVKLNDLSYISYDDYIHKNPDFQSLDQSIAIQRYYHYINRKKKLITSLKNIRHEIIKDKNDSSASFMKYNTPSNYYNNNLMSNEKSKNNSLSNFNKTFHIFKNISLKKSASMNNFIEQNKSLMLLDQETKFNKKRQRQLINIKREIDFQLSKEQERMKSLEKMRRKSENEKIIQKKKLDELNIRKFKYDRREKEKKLKLDHFKKKLEEKQQEKLRKDAIKQLSEQKKREEEEIQRKIKFENREKKSKEIRDKVIKKNLLHHMELIEKQNKMDEIQRKREKLLEQKKDEMSKMIEEKLIINKIKINNVLEEKEKKLEQKILLYNLKQKKYEEFQKQKEKEKNDEQINLLNILYIN